MVADPVGHGCFTMMTGDMPRREGGVVFVVIGTNSILRRRHIDE